MKFDKFIKENTPENVSKEERARALKELGSTSWPAPIELVNKYIDELDDIFSSGNGFELTRWHIGAVRDLFSNITNKRLRKDVVDAWFENSDVYLHSLTPSDEDEAIAYDYELEVRDFMETYRTEK